jgi:dolichol-phosphate mannosyltransferase
MSIQKESRVIRKQAEKPPEQTMTSLQQHEDLFELLNDSVMTRSMEGRISSWNRSAEELYGWGKEEAIGRVSHNLLQTQFPKPLEEIESELVRKRRWQGRLVHTTRDGRRVVVESRWTLPPKGESEGLIEINTLSTDGESHTEDIARPNQPSSMRSVLLNREAPIFSQIDANSQPAVTPAGGPELSIIVPTFNERENVTELIERLERYLMRQSWEVIFVDDDSPDLTANLVREMAQRDCRVRCLQRIGRRGLSSACIEGMLASSAPYLAVIDGDLQHDEQLLLSMLHVLKNEELDIVIGSRYASGGGFGAWDRSRAKISRAATWLSRLVIRTELTDPMSGFFMIRRDAFAGSVRKLSAIGFKILLDLFASSPRPLRFRELPYQFRSRQAGESKLDSHALWDYGMLLLDKLVGHLLPVRFVAFTLVGSFGVLVHLTAVTFLFKGLKVAFVPSQTCATFLAITSNFALNNLLTYRDMRLKGWPWFRGWATFTLVCGLGALANVGIADYLFGKGSQWLLAALAGIGVGAVWNYATSMVYTWNGVRRI